MKILSSMVILSYLVRGACKNHKNWSDRNYREGFCKAKRQYNGLAASLLDDLSVDPASRQLTNKKAG